MTVLGQNSKTSNVILNFKGFTGSFPEHILISTTIMQWLVLLSHSNKVLYAFVLSRH